MYMQPDSVSFQYISWIEMNATDYATGAWLCFNGSGHSPNPSPAPVLADVPGLGSKVSLTDVEYTADCGYSPPFGASVEDFNIPEDYYSSGGKYLITVVLQAGNLAPGGTGGGILTMKKGAAISPQISVNSPTTTY
jgi:hypothetical protein